MISNATILDLQNAASTPTGGATYSPATLPDAGIRCCVDAPTNAQLIVLGATLAEVSIVVYVLDADAGSLAFAPRQRVEVIEDGSSARTFEVIRADHRSKEDLSHWTLFLKVRG